MFTKKPGKSHRSDERCQSGVVTSARRELSLLVLSARVTAPLQSYIIFNREIKQHTINIRPSRSHTLRQIKQRKCHGQYFQGFF